MQGFIKQRENISVGDRVVVRGRGAGTVTEVLPQALDCDGNWRTPYRVQLDSAGSFLAHPDNMMVVPRLEMIP